MVLSAERNPGNSTVQRVEELLAEQEGGVLTGPGWGDWGASVAKCPGLRACSLTPREPQSTEAAAPRSRLPFRMGKREETGAVRGKENRRLPPRPRG